MDFVFCIIYKSMCECDNTYSTATYLGEVEQLSKYHGIFNWHGELHRLWTTAESKGMAYKYFITRLATTLNRSRRSVLVYFNDASKANWEIKGE